MPKVDPETTEKPPALLISNIAEAEAYLTGFVDGALISLRLSTTLDDTRGIRARCARMRELLDDE